MCVCVRECVCTYACVYVFTVGAGAAGEDNAGAGLLKCVYVCRVKCECGCARARQVRGFLVSITLALDYCLMFVAMTFNVGLFAAVCVGAGLGAVLFGHNGMRQRHGGVARTHLLEDRACCS